MKLWSSQNNWFAKKTVARATVFFWDLELLLCASAISGITWNSARKSFLSALQQPTLSVVFPFPFFRLNFTSCKVISAPGVVPSRPGLFHSCRHPSFFLKSCWFIPLNRIPLVFLTSSSWRVFLLPLPASYLPDRCLPGCCLPDYSHPESSSSWRVTSPCDMFRLRFWEKPATGGWHKTAWFSFLSFVTDLILYIFHNLNQKCKVRPGKTNCLFVHFCGKCLTR